MGKKRSSPKSDDKENEPSRKKRSEKSHEDDEKELARPKRGKQPDENEKKLKKSTSASKIDEVKVEQKSVKSARGKQKGLANEEVMEMEEPKKKGSNKKGMKKKVAE